MSKDLQPGSPTREERDPEDEDFYIGWMSAAPKAFASHVRKVVIALTFLVIATGIILSLQQRKFSTAGFEFGQLTEVKGVYRHFPVPSLKVMTERDMLGNASFITMPLVGYGKFGAGGVIAALEMQKNISFDQHEVTLRGTLLYSDGKTLLQIDENDDPLVNINAATGRYTSPVIKELGTMQLTGEILDPKCYFGVMKPGQGKPHRDCAIRCIAGGISPVFYVRDDKGATDYYLVLDAAGKKMNETLKDHVAEPVSLQAKLVQYDDWKILYVLKESIHRTGGMSWFKHEDQIISCGKSAQ